MVVVQAALILLGMFFGFSVTIAMTVKPLKVKSHPPGAVRIRIVGEETDLWYVGATITLVCEFTTAGTNSDPPAKFHWAKMENVSFSYNGPTLVLRDVNTNHSGTYDCTASNDHGVTTDTIALTVEPLPSLIYSDTTSVNAHVIVVTEGLPVVLNCGARGWPAFELVWCRYGDWHQHNCHRRLQSALSVQTRPYFEAAEVNITVKYDDFPPTADSPPMLYQCVAKSIDGNVAWRIFMLTKQAPVEAHPFSLAITGEGQSPGFKPVGDNLFLSCDVTDESARSRVGYIRWVNPLGHHVEYLSDFVNPLHRNQQPIGPSQLYMGDLQESHSGNYTCVAGYPGHDQLVATYHLTVFRDVTFDEAPDKQHIEAILGSFGKIKCATSGQTAPLVTWLRNGWPIAPGGRFEFVKDGLSISNITKADSGQYMCRAVVVLPGVGAGKFTQRKIDVTVAVRREYYGTFGKCHLIQNGDDLHKVALHYGISELQIYQLNFGRKDNGFLSAGQQLSVAASSPPADNMAALPCHWFHIVQDDDVDVDVDVDDDYDDDDDEPEWAAKKIAAANGITFDELKRFNPKMGDMTDLNAGDQLRIR